MEFVCLAAGKGTRFGRLGTYLQKCMYPVGLRPFVAYSVRNLARSPGFDPSRDRLTFVVGHHAEQVRSYFGDGWQPDDDGSLPEVQIRYVEQDEALGTGHALHVAASDLQPEAPVVAWLADLYVPSALFGAIRSHPMSNVLAIAPDPHGENPNVAVSLTGNRVTRAWQGTGPSYDVGLWKFSPDVLAGMLGRQLDEYRALPSLQRLIEEGVADVGWVRADAWIHLGGTAPSPEANVRDVVRTVMELEPPA